MNRKQRKREFNKCKHAIENGMKHPIQAIEKLEKERYGGILDTLYEARKQAYKQIQELEKRDGLNEII